jgi:tyrosine-protein phosphatase SIW14
MKAVLLSVTVTVSLLAALSAPEISDVGRFYKVDNQVFRGAQPSEQGFRSLAKLGVRTVIDLRQTSSRSRWEEDVVRKAGMRYVAFPIGSWLAVPDATQIHSILKILNDPSQGPVFVHCKQGKDRTGAVIACYRIQHDRWDNARALKEARDIGMSWFQVPKQQFVLKFVADGQNVPAVTVVPASLLPVPAQ